MILTALALAGIVSAKLDYPIAAVPFTSVRIQAGFWAERQLTNATKTLAHLLDQNEKTGRNENFKAAVGVPGAIYDGYFFNDSDVYKSIEAIGFSLSIRKDPALERRTDAVIDLIAAAQEPSGYLHTSTQALKRGQKTPGPSEPWHEDGGEHETYNMGHLYEGAVAYYQATGKRKLLDVALRSADLICKTFGPGGTAKHPSGHEEIEIGLVKLYRLTGTQRYLDTAKLFLERRGHKEGRKFLFGDYSQDHKPVREQTEAVGHAVRAAYLYAGIADVGALTADKGYLAALDNLWNSAVGKKSYITGAIGATGAGEAFGAEYELPNLTAYAETCSSIAFMMWNHRMFLLHGDAKYMDMFEQTLYNAFLSGYAQDGCHFFYPNPLQSRGATRPEWFGCACCPPNVARFLASLGGYAYAMKAEKTPTLYATMFMEGRATMKVAGENVTISSKTSYPWDGKMVWTFQSSKPVKFDFAIRRPGWSRGEAHPMNLYTFAGADINALSLDAGNKKVDESNAGFIRLSGTWKSGDKVVLNLNMRPIMVQSDANVAANHDRIAVQRGPVIYCAEFADQPDKKVLNLVANPSAEISLKKRTGIYGQVPVLEMTMRRAVRDAKGNPEVSREKVKATLSPYFMWANRGPGEMTVWLPTAASSAWPDPAPTLAYRAKVTSSFNGGTLPALKDQLLPKNSIDHGVPYFHVWPHKGTTEWVEFAWDSPQTISSADVYWFQDEGIGECRTPEAWNVLHWNGENWVKVNGTFGVEKDKVNRAVFSPVSTTKLRIEVIQQRNWASGIHEVVLR